MASLKITRDDGVVVTLPLSFTAGLSDPVQLPGSSVVVRVRSDAEVGTAWRVVEQRAPSPGDDPGAVAARLSKIGEANLVSLWGAAPSGSYLGWKSIWESDLPLPYRLGAFLLAFASRIRELRSGGQ